MLKNNQNQNTNNTLLVLRLRTKDKQNPHFEVLAKDEAGKWSPQHTVTSVSGSLTKIEPKKSTINGDVISTLQVYIKDNDELYLVDLPYNMLSRGIINSLLSLADPKSVVEISLYVNKKGYPSATVRANNERLDWKYALAELPKPDEVTFKGKVQRDFSKLDSFFENEILSWGKSTLAENTANSVVTEQATEPEVADKKKSQKTKGNKANSDDLPF